MNTIDSVVPRHIARSLEHDKIKRELLQKHAAELKAASWWKAFLIRQRIAREVNRRCRQRSKATKRYDGTI